MDRSIASGLRARTNALVNLPFDLRGDRIDVEARLRQEGARILDLIDARHARCSTSANPAAASLAAYSSSLQRAGDAADPQLHAPPDVGRHLAAHDDVGDGEAAARLQHAERLAQHRGPCRPTG